MRPYNQGNDFPTLLALVVAVGFPLLLLSLVFDIFPRERLDRILAELNIPGVPANARPSPSPVTGPVVLPSPSPLALAAADWDIPNGHFFTQTNARPPLSSATGFAVTNVGGLAFWDEFQKLGGVDAVGFPLSNRFTWRGFTVQVFQRLVLQGAERGGEVNVLNLLDELSAAGKDEFLARERLVPVALAREAEAGRDPGEIPALRLELLKEDPALENYYREAKDPLRRFGLPTSRVTDMGEHLIAIRCQRAVLQHWKKDMPWARAGEVTIANAGQIALETGLFAGGDFTPTVQAPPQAATAPGATSVPGR